MPVVSLKDTDKCYEVLEGRVLYDALHDQGEVLPHGCLSGSCGACKIEVISGGENLSLPGVIEQDTISSLQDEFKDHKNIELNNIRLSCRAKVMGDVTIRPFK